MPCKKIKKSIIDPQTKNALESLSEKIESHVQELKNKMEELRKSEIENAKQLIEETVPEEILNMKLVDFLKEEKLHHFLSKNLTSETEELEDCENNENLTEKIDIKYSEDLNSESSLTQESNLPIQTDESRNTPVHECPRLHMKTPSGIDLLVPRMIKPKMDGEMLNAFRKPHDDEQVAFSIHGSPMVIQDEESQKIRELKTVLEINEYEASPESKLLAENVKKLLRKNMAKKEKLDIKQEPGTAV